MPEQTSQTTATSAAAQAQQRTLPLSRIVVADGFNHREDLNADGSFPALVASVRRHGILTPIRVRDLGTGDFEIIAGHRRYAAAAQAALTEVPCVIRPAGQGESGDDEAQRRVEALIENEHRADIDPVERARAYAHLRQSGLTVKGIAESAATTQARVREHLRILELPDTVLGRVRTGRVPLLATKALGALAALHPELPALVLAAVAEPDPDEEPLTWAEVAADPIGAVRTLPEERYPTGVYGPGSQPLLDELPLDEQAQKHRAALLKLGQPAGRLVLDRDAVQRADALKALHRGQRDWEWLIVGEDVMAQLAADALAAALKLARRAERERKAADQQAAERRAKLQSTPGAESEQVGEGQDAAPDEPQETRAEVEARLKAERLAARTAELARRRQAEAFNDRLGALVTGKLSRIKVDARALQLIASVGLADQLDKLASRGARYGFPGWVREAEGRGGSLKREYLGTIEAGQKAREYLAGAQTPGDHAGRLVALLVMAVFADQHAVADSSRIGFEVRGQGTPWAADVPALVDELAAEYLPGGFIDEQLRERREQRAQAAEIARLREEAAQRVLSAIEQGLDGLSRSELEALQADVAVAWTPWSMERYGIERQLTEALKHHACAEPQPKAEDQGDTPTAEDPPSQG